MEPSWVWVMICLWTWLCFPARVSSTTITVPAIMMARPTKYVHAGLSSKRKKDRAVPMKGGNGVVGAGFGGADHALGLDVKEDT